MAALVVAPLTEKNKSWKILETTRKVKIIISFPPVELTWGKNRSFIYL